MDPNGGRDGLLRTRVLEGALLAGCLLVGALLAGGADLEPRVESDFFFASDDPQLAASREVADRFPGSPQILLATRSPDPFSDEAVEATEALSSGLLALETVTGVRSLTRGPASPGIVPESPVWSRLLLGDDPSSASLIVEMAEAGPDAVAAIEAVLEERRRPSFSITASGVPWVVEHIRRRLGRDLRVFSVASALLLLGTALILHRSFPIVAGTVATCVLAVASTLAVLGAAEVPIGPLTANLVTIVFVLALSHTLFLGAARRRRSGAGPPAVLATVKEVLPASFWCMVTTLSGFLSLLTADARPLRELGTAGAVGTGAAFLAAYLVFPLFLARVARADDGDATTAGGTEGTRLDGRPGVGATVALALLAVVAIAGAGRVVTDPRLPEYFHPADPIRTGLEAIDRNGGSSPLELVVRDPGSTFDARDPLERLASAQAALESDPDVGVSLSLAVLIEEARRHPLAGFLGEKALVGILMGPMFDQVARGFLSEDRTSTRFLLRMRELERSEPRRDVVERLTGIVEAEGLEVELVGGLYDLQGRLGDLVAGSLLRGVGGLLLLFSGIALVASRSLRTTGVVLVALAAVPWTLVGGAGLVGVPLDLVASPALNVAIALGVDAMIHLMLRARREGGGGAGWSTARAALRRPILEAAVLVGVGFGVFALSSFPPTRNFGLLVAVGASLSAVAALQILPRWASGRAVQAE